MTLAIQIEDFKCFKRLSVEIPNLTILTGYNAAGKSTVIQGLLLMSQTLREAFQGSVVDLNGPLVELGNATDVGHFGAQAISFSLQEGDVFARWDLTAEKRSRVLKVDAATFGSSKHHAPTVLNKVAPSSENPAFGLCESIRDLSFLGASRLFSTSAWPSPPMNTPFGNVGKSGEYAPYWHFQLGDEEVPDSRKHPTDERSTIRGQIDAYMSDLFPGAQANTDQLSGVNLYRLDLRLAKSEWVSPGNIGFGLTYVFPLLVSLLSAKDSQIVIIDSPEAHLHPRAQSELGRIVSRFAKAGLRIIVETHSDHFLNGVRLAARDGIIPSESVAIYFFSGVKPDDHGVQTPRLDRNGSIDFWPPGFFDQSENDFSKLLGMGE